MLANKIANFVVFLYALGRFYVVCLLQVN